MKKLKITESQYKRLENYLLKESKFSWDGKYANETDIHEHHEGKYSEELMNKTLDEFLDELRAKDKPSYELVEGIIEKYFNAVEEGKDKIVGFPADIELAGKMDEDCGCNVSENEPTDVKSSQWFSDAEGELVTDKDSAI